MKRIRQKQAGFTLIELMMAMVILGIGIMSIVALQTNNMNLNSSSKRQTEGYTWVMDKIERLLSEPYDNTGELAVGAHAPIAADAAMIVPYTMAWNVTDNTINIPNSRQVSVVVQWKGRQVANVDFVRTSASF